jgi:hypothetical protein
LTVKLLRLFLSLGRSAPNAWEGFVSVMSGAGSCVGRMGESGRTSWVGDGGGVKRWMLEEKQDMGIG